MIFHDSSKSRERDFKYLGSTSRWTFWTFFDGHSDTIHILVCHNSWKTCGEVFRENITMLTKKFNPLWNGSVVWKSCRRSKVEIFLRAFAIVRVLWPRFCPKTLIIAKKCLHSKGRCCTLHRYMMNKFPDLA